MPTDHPFLAFAHIGDLHIADKDPAHIETFRAAAAQVEAVRQHLAFAFLPGDIADNGKPEQYD
ncbi:MAG: metallophosphoesterase, partial [Caulobacteraceae bacterium]|nr:metallophosphoesterase [Caulobacter sp.]